jgi:3-dehydrosphinganine reductase
VRILNQFSGKTVIVTGGSSGLGLAFGHELARRGARVVLFARDRAKLEEAESSIRSKVAAAEVQIVSVDVSAADALGPVMDGLARNLGGIDALFNSAGILREGRFEALRDEDFRRVMDVNYFGTLWTTRAALPYLRASGGRIVNIASMAGLTGVYGYAAYSSSKFALVGLSEALRVELRRTGVRVHLVCPPEFDSPMVEELDRDRTPENRAHTLSIAKTTIDSVVRETLAGVTRGRFLIVPGTWTKLAAFGIRHFPAASRAVVDRRLQGLPASTPRELPPR